MRNILPPGQSGSINAAEAAQVAAGDPQGRVAVDGQNAPPNFADQLEMYDALNHADLGALTDGQLSSFYKDAPLTLSNKDAVRTDRPKSGVVIRWDSFGVPYIEGKTREDAAFGSGYAGTKDRMFLMDLLRHVGAARAAEFLGPDDANVAMDQEQLRSAFYTPEEAAAQIDQAAKRFGAEGRRLVAALDAYIAGINAAQQEMCPAVVTGPDCPVEYAALQKKPEPWTRADVVYVASLVGGIFGKGGGAEFANARWLQQLEARFGADEAKRIFDDLALADDPQAPTTSSNPAPYGSGPVDPTTPGRGPARPRRPDRTRHRRRRRQRRAARPGAGLAAGPVRHAGPGDVVQGPFGPIDLGGVPDMMSNAALVAGNRTADGHPRVVFGPQTGYFTPQLLTEQAVVAPGIRARGVSFAGTSLVVQLGRGVDYAWSATSAGSDLVDTVVERLCDPAGGTATVESEGTCRQRVPADGPAGARGDGAAQRGRPGPAQTYRFLVLRTEHGSCSCGRRSTGSRSRSCSSAAPTAGSSTPRSASSGWQPRLREGRRRLPQRRRGHRLHVQLVLRRRPGHRLLLVGPAAAARGRRRRPPAALGRRRLRLAGLAGRRRPPAAGQPAVGLPGLLEQQAGARVHRRRRPVGLRAGAPQPGDLRPARRARRRAG